VKAYDGRRWRMPSHGKSSHGLWPGELKRGISLVKICRQIVIIKLDLDILKIHLHTIPTLTGYYPETKNLAN
jgi:hypothetical protein